MLYLIPFIPSPSQLLQLSRTHSLTASTTLYAQIHEGKSITCLQAEYNSGSEGDNDKDGTDDLGWLVASGDKKGHVVITRSAISLQSWYLKQKDWNRSEGLGLGLGSGKHPPKKHSDRRSRSNSSEVEQHLFTSISITALIGAGSVTCLTFTKKKSQSYVLIGFASNMRESPCWEHLVIGTSLGRMAVVDVLSAQVSSCMLYTHVDLSCSMLFCSVDSQLNLIVLYLISISSIFIYS